MAEIASGTAGLDDVYKVFSVRFEDPAREFLLLKRPVEFETPGRWWFRRENIDIVALKEDTATLIEVKWKEVSERDTRRVLKELRPLRRELSLWYYWGKVENREGAKEGMPLRPGSGGLFRDKAFLFPRRSPWGEWLCRSCP